MRAVGGFFYDLSSFSAVIDYNGTKKGGKMKINDLNRKKICQKLMALWILVVLGI